MLSGSFFNDENQTVLLEFLDVFVLVPLLLLLLRGNFDLSSLFFMGACVY